MIVQTLEKRLYICRNKVAEFNDHESGSIKSIVVKKLNTIKVTSQFMSGKLPMFAKLSLKSFIYELRKTMCFLNKTVLNIYKKYGIEKVEILHVLTDPDSPSVKFFFFFVTQIVMLPTM